MTDANSLSTQGDGQTTAFDLLMAVGALMRDCHRESLALQDAIAEQTPENDRRVAHIETYQHIDHVTQVHDDLARLLPELAQTLGDGRESVDHLSCELRLISLRERLFRCYPQTDPTHSVSGDVSLF